jgi:hypothetical protein
VGKFETSTNFLTRWFHSHQRDSKRFKKQGLHSIAFRSLSGTRALENLYRETTVPTGEMIRPKSNCNNTPNDQSRYTFFLRWHPTAKAGHLKRKALKNQSPCRQRPNYRAKGVKIVDDLRLCVEGLSGPKVSSTISKKALQALEM